MLKISVSRMRCLPALMVGAVIFAVLLGSFQSCIAEKIFPQFVTHSVSLTQSHVILQEESDCSHPQFDVRGILSALTLGTNLAPKKDAPLPYSLILLALLLSVAMERRIFLPALPESRFIHRNPVLFKLSKVRLLI